MKNSPPPTSLKLYLIRHGETAWSLSGQHTGLTDLPLLDSGKKQAEALKKRLKPLHFSQVFTSPLKRAQETLSITGLKAEIDPDLVEWNYGEYEGLTSEEIHKQDPTWDLFTQGAPGGETPGNITARANRFLSRVRGLEGCVAIFSSAHFLRSLACCWVNAPLALGKSLILSPASLSILSFDRKTPVIVRWNDISHIEYK